ncbi:MAG: stage V sporulation protein SpoVM [Clostridia bacterium]|nr:stage V sporulation protein SpoVM [Clostridia bacterium]
MKVVVFKSPKVLGGLLRMLFGIKKQDVLNT